ncbi:sodium-coupled monocarboxylate transporter 1-like [Styela clava]
MTDTENDITLKAADYAVFGVMLGISAIVGIYFAIKDRNAKGDVENYLLGGRKISWLASGFSSSLSFLSAVSVLGIPAEMMYYGGGYCMLIFSILLCNAISAEMILPIYYKLGLSSAYEYLGLRFGPVVRTIATTIYILQTITYTGVMMFAPALVLNAVAGFSLWGAVLSIGAVCILYTTLI